MSDHDASTFNAEHIQKALDEIPEHPNMAPLRYWATASQFNDPAWMARFHYNFPDVEVMLSRPIPI